MHRRRTMRARETEREPPGLDLFIVLAFQLSFTRVPEQYPPPPFFSFFQKNE